MGITIEIRTDVIDILSIMPQWAELHRCVGQSPFSSAEWISAWFDAWPSPTMEPMFGLAWKNDTLIAGWPLGLKSKSVAPFAPQVKSLQALCDDKSGYHELLIADEHPNVAHALIQAYRQTAAWDMIDLSPIKHSAGGASFIRAANQSRLSVSERSEIRTVHVDLSNGWEAYLASRSREFRKSLRSSNRKLDKLDHEFVTLYETHNSGTETLQQAIALSGRCWKAKLGTDLETNPNLARFIQALFHHMGPNGQISLDLLMIEGKAVASFIVVYHRDSAFGLISDMDERYAKLSLGRLIICRAMERMTQSGITEVDLLRATPFTERFATRTSDLVRLKAVRPLSVTNAMLNAQSVLRPLGKSYRKKKQLLHRKRAGNKDHALALVTKENTQND